MHANGQIMIMMPLVKYLLHSRQCPEAALNMYHFTQRNLHTLEEGTATHSSILAWRILWTEEPGGLQSIESQSWTRLSDLTLMHTWGLHSGWCRRCMQRFQPKDGFQTPLPSENSKTGPELIKDHPMSPLLLLLFSH